VSANAFTPLRRSIEVEYWVVDDDGRLVEPGPLVGASPGVEREFVEPMLEVKTTPCETTAELRAELYDRLRAVLDRAEDCGRRLVPLSTPVDAEAVAELDSERTAIQNDVVGSDFQYVRHCAGTHIHVEQQDGRAIDQLNALIALDPALALVNSSPYFQGRYLAAGARSKLYRWMAYDDLPHQGRLWPYVDDREEWDRRLERRFEEFVTRAEATGVDHRAIHAHFDPESAVWTPVQLREAFGTVEWRSPDTALPSQVLQLADDVAGAVETLAGREVRIEGSTGEITDDAVVLPEFDSVVGYLNAAIRDGLSAASVRSYLDRMGFDVDAYDPPTHDIGDQNVLDGAGARRLRLAYADRLADDIRQSPSVRAE
jgi:gamma-glutamyl:cysteine ligase YbdK (ATP-grasp superfamily)